MTDRNALIDLCFQRGQLLTPDQPEYRACVVQFLNWLMTWDSVSDDKTTKLLQLSHPSRAVITSKQNGIVAGLQEVFLLFDKSEITAKFHCKDGDSVEKGQ